MLKFNKVNENDLEIIVKGNSIIVEEVDFDVDKDIGAIYFIINFSGLKLDVDEVIKAYIKFLDSL